MPVLRALWRALLAVFRFVCALGGLSVLFGGVFMLADFTLLHDHAPHLGTWSWYAVAGAGLWLGFCIAAPLYLLAQVWQLVGGWTGRREAADRRAVLAAEG